MPIWAGICGQCAPNGSSSAAPVAHLKESATALATVVAGTNITGAVGAPNLNTQLLNYLLVDFVEDVNVYLNGQAMENGPDAGTPNDVYPGTNQATGDLKFTRKIKTGDVVIMEIFPLAS